MIEGEDVSIQDRTEQGTAQMHQPCQSSGRLNGKSSQI
jgi:hypothetical protein